MGSLRNTEGGNEGSRVFAVDALRGFALAGIVVAHMWEQFIAAPRPTEAWGVEATAVDHTISTVVMMLFYGKFYSMFALLFGISFAIMMGNAASKGQNFTGRFLWRLVLLGVIGVFHAAIYRGDILTAYVAIGFMLPLFYNLSGPWLWGIALALFAGIGPYIVYYFIGKSSFLPWDSSPNSPAVLEYVATLKHGSFVDVVKENLTTGLAHKFDFLVAIFGRGYQTLAYFLLGLWLVRVGIVHNLDQHKRLLKRTLWWSLLFSFVFVAVVMGSFALDNTIMTFTSWLHVFLFSFYNLFNIAVTLFFISGFLLLFLRTPSTWLMCFAPYGRMALSNYIIQSLLGTFILFGWGLGLLGDLHDWQTLIIALGVIVAQMYISKVWLTHFKYGPLEWLWRCGTFFSWIPLRKAQSTAQADIG